MITIILVYVLMTYGLSNLIVYGSGPYDMLIRMRNYLGKVSSTIGDMLQCMMCTSTNVGWILSLINILLIPTIPFTPFNIIFNNSSLWYLIIPLDASFTSGCVWLIHTLQELMESKTNDYE